MISLYQLKNKLNKQAKEFAELLEFPDLYAQGLWARGVYNCPHFSDTHNSLTEAFEQKKTGFNSKARFPEILNDQ